MARPSGVDEDNSFYLRLSGISADYSAEDELNADLELLRNMPGIVAVSPTNALPLGRSGSAYSYSLEAVENPEVSVSAAIYRVDDHALDAFGLNLIEGVNFVPDDVDYLPTDEEPAYTKIIVSRAFAQKILGEEGPYIGKVVYAEPERPVTIIGVVETLQVPWPSASWAEQALLLPLKRKSSYQGFLVRTETGRLNQMMPAVVEALRKRNPNRIIRDPKAYSEIRNDCYRKDRAMRVILTTTVGVLFIITSLGIVGLASFSVNRRKKQIGTRRALGARRVDIIRYFLAENWLITSMGLALGAVLTYLLNYWLVETYSMSRISWYYLPGGMLVIWLLGLFAVWVPATRAASISPALATRSA